jgi:hypothetical protein
MPANIFARDVQTGLEMAWHNKTNVVPEVTFENAFPWELSRIPAYFNSKKKGQSGPPKFTKLPGITVFVADDDGEICGKPVADSYDALTNSEFWGVATDALKGTGATIESAGTLFDRSRRFLTIRLSDDSVNIGGREFKNRISFIDSIDMSTLFYAVNTSTCVVCSNTARAVMGDNSGEFQFKIRHTTGETGLRAKIEDANKTIESMIGVQAIFNSALRLASEESKNPETAKNLFAGWLGEGAERLSTRTRNTIDRLVSLHRGGAGNRGETLLDAVSAVTDFYSHESRGEAKTEKGEVDSENTRAKQWLSSEYGTAMRKKVEFMQSIFVLPTRKSAKQSPEINFARISEFEKNGEKLLAIPAK